MEDAHAAKPGVSQRRHDKTQYNARRYGEQGELAGYSQPVPEGFGQEQSLEVIQPYIGGDASARVCQMEAEIYGFQHGIEKKNPEEQQGWSEKDVS
ncbi:hypothetical protein D3C81_2076440 [compost metagenome]